MTSGFVSRAFVGLFAALVPLAAFAADAPPSYTLSGSVTLGAPDRWDYLTFDTQAKRVYVSHGDRVTVVDAATGKVVGEVADLAGSHGPRMRRVQRGHGRLGPEKRSHPFRRADVEAARHWPAGDYADGIGYDASVQRAFIANGDAGTVTAIDMASGKVAGTVTLGSKPEFLVSDGAGHLYVNGESSAKSCVSISRHSR